MNLAHSWAIFGDRERVGKYLTWIVNHASPTYGWAEGISIITERGGGQGDAPHGWAAADFIMLIRDLIINDLFEAPILLRGMPADLLRRGVTASNILTIHGLVKNVSALMKGKEFVINYEGPGKPIGNGQYELLIDSPITPREVQCGDCRYEMISSNTIRVMHSGKFTIKVIGP